MPKVCHKLIAETAKEIAREAYEDAAGDNTFYQIWPNRRGFVARNWTMYVDHARKALMQILTGNFPDAMKEPIYEALLIDGMQKTAHEKPKGLH